MKETHVKVGNRRYNVRSLDDETFDTTLANYGVYDESVKSFIHYDEQLIVIRDRLSAEHKQELIIHELIHACIEDTGTEQSEEFVSVLAPRLSALMSAGLHKVIKKLTNPASP